MVAPPLFDAKELVLAKMSGYPAWPAFVMPKEKIPPLVLKAKKKSAGICVIFIPDGDFYWMSEKNLEGLSREKLKEKVAKIPELAKRNNKKKGARTNNVNEALLAAENLEFDVFIETVFDEDEDEEDDDEEDEDKEDAEEEEDAVEAPTKKRRGRQPNLPPKRQKTSPESEENTANGDKEQLSDEEKQKQLWQCRIKLQRTLIQRNQPTTPKDTSGLKPPSAEELSMARFIMNRLQDFPVTTDLLRQTKIHKVLKCIVKDPDLSYPDLFNLHQRLQELLTKWDPHIHELKKEK